MGKHNELGRLGEELAVDYLLQKGYGILETNWRFQKAEVDIIASKDEFLVVVEVKTRSTNEFGDPQDFVRKKKIKLLVQAIDAYVSRFALEAEVRFDIVAITMKKQQLEIEHLKDAFYHF